MGTPRPRKIAWISGTERCSRWRKAPTSANQRHDIEAELVLRQGERALGLGTIGLVEAGAAHRLTAADLQTQPHRAGQRHQRASVLVADPHGLATGRAEPSDWNQHPFAIRDPDLGARHSTPPIRRPSSIPYQTAH